jgi:aminopeptidase N
MKLKHSVGKSLTLVFLIALVSSGVAPARSLNELPQQSTELQKLPPKKEVRPRKIDVKHIAIDLRFDWQKKQAHGAATLTLAPLNNTEMIALDAGMLTINSITLAGGTPLRFKYDGGDKNDGLQISLDRVYSAGEEVIVRIDYRTNWVNLTNPNNLWGSFGKGIRFLGPTSTDPKKRRQIWSMGDPESNRYWFPGYDSPDDFRTSELTATVDDKLTVVSNGNLLETKTNPDGTRTFHWKMDTPYANHLTSFVAGEYVDIKQEYDGIELHSFGYADEAEAVAASVVRLPDMMKFYSEVTGMKYPFPSYSQVFVQEFPAWMGNITASTITENMVDDFPTHAEWFYLWDITEAEALAGQWFGNYLTSRDWSQVWLNKSFAHYLAGLFNQHKNGRDEFLLYQVNFDQNTIYLNDWNSGNRRPVVTRNYQSADAFTSDNYSTQRGALVLRMLHKHLGDEKWWKAIRHYLQTNANKPVSTEDFRKAIKESSGESMEWFFDQWLYKMGHPIFEVTSAYDDAKKQLTLKLKQTQAVDPKDPFPQVEFFEGKMEIEIDDRIEAVLIEPKAENVFTFAASQQPNLVNPDYESVWIKEIKFEKSLDELLYQFQNDKDILGRRWAMAELVVRAKNGKTSGTDKAKIYAGFRNVILSNSYWRLRTMAMSQLQALIIPATQTKPVSLDKETAAMLKALLDDAQPWVRAGALTFLGFSRDAKFADIYLIHLNDRSDRVVNAAAIALGRSNSSKAFDALVKLVKRPSWKNQSLISALNGLREPGDERGYKIAFQALSDLNSPHWTLATPTWDYRLTAAQTIAVLGKSDAAYPLLLAGFKKAMDEDDLHGIFYNVLLITTLAEPRGKEMFELLKTKFKDAPGVMIAVSQYEAQFNDVIKRSR